MGIRRGWEKLAPVVIFRATSTLCGLWVAFPASFSLCGCWRCRLGASVVVFWRFGCVVDGNVWWQKGTTSWSADLLVRSSCSMSKRREPASDGGGRRAFGEPFKSSHASFLWASYTCTQPSAKRGEIRRSHGEATVSSTSKAGISQRLDVKPFSYLSPVAQVHSTGRADWPKRALN